MTNNVANLASKHLAAAAEHKLEKTGSASSKESRAKRMRILRKMSGLTRSDFNRRYNISASNFQNWEGPRYGGLTESAAIKFLDCIRREGISSSLEWLMYGSGPAPSILPNAFDALECHTQQSKSMLQRTEIPLEVQNELNHFRSHHDNVLEFLLEDDSMRPFFIPNEMLAGVVYRGHHLISTVGKDCIVILSNGKKLFRHIASHTENNRFNLVSHNWRSNTSDLLLHQVEIIEAAPVVWRRLVGA